MRHIIPVSGKDSCATAIVQMERESRDDYELFFNDVGSELPETYVWLNEVEKALGIPIKRVGKSLERIIDEEGMLPSPSVRFCTRLAKIKPMEEFIGEDEAVVYFGIRADEDRSGYHVDGKSNITPKYPLKEEGIGLEQVYKIVGEKGLSPPKFFWVEVHRRVKMILEIREGSQFFGERDILNRLPAWVFDSLFAWRSRTNCFHCFYQRLYEWVGLLEHHPDLFDKAQKMEEGLKDRREKSYTWINGVPLKLVRRERDRIIRRRVHSILQEIGGGKMSLATVDGLARSSCGLFCGK